MDECVKQKHLDVSKISQILLLTALLESIDVLCLSLKTHDSVYARVNACNYGNLNYACDS